MDNKQLQEQQQTCIICEQGDMGLFADPLSEADNEKLKKQQENESK